MDLTALMRKLTDLVARARAGSLKSSELSDPTITVTNLGDQVVARSSMGPHRISILFETQPSRESR